MEKCKTCPFQANCFAYRMLQACKRLYGTDVSSFNCLHYQPPKPSTGPQAIIDGLWWKSGLSNKVIDVSPMERQRLFTEFVN